MGEEDGYSVSLKGSWDIAQSKAESESHKAEKEERWKNKNLQEILDTQAAVLKLGYLKKLLDHKNWTSGV